MRNNNGANTTENFRRIRKGESVFFGIGVKPSYCNKGVGKVIT
ncbi:hypothetical protein [Clostridium sp.]